MSVNESTKRLQDIPMSVLDLCPIVAGGTPADAFRNSLDLAQHAEKWGFNRYWLAEHHNMPGIASSATSVVISYIANGTSTIRIGSGGIMLPNHSPLVIAEQFGTLESMFPGRIDLGLGRAPGTDQRTIYALRRDLRNHGEDFPEQLDELRSYFNPGSSAPPVRAVPGEGLNIPIWLLGSSGFSARLAGQLGLPFGFASHFSPEYTLPALEIYRKNFRPSAVLERPHAMVGVNVIAADTDEKADLLATSQQQQFLSLLRGRPAPLQPPVETMEGLWTAGEREALEQKFRYAMIGSPNTVKENMQAFLDSTQADEMMITSPIYDHQDRLRSYEIVTQFAINK
jgi:luciferase family oxidoreductase group 1